MVFEGPKSRTERAKSVHAHSALQKRWDAKRKQTDDQIKSAQDQLQRLKELPLATSGDIHSCWDKGKALGTQLASLKKLAKDRLPSAETTPQIPNVFKRLTHTSESSTGSDPEAAQDEYYKQIEAKITPLVDSYNQWVREVMEAKRLHAEPQPKGPRPPLMSGSAESVASASSGHADSTPFHSTDSMGSTSAKGFEGHQAEYAAPSHSAGSTSVGGFEGHQGVDPVDHVDSTSAGGLEGIREAVDPVVMDNAEDFHEKLGVIEEGAELIPTTSGEESVEMENLNKTDAEASQEEIGHNENIKDLDVAEEQAMTFGGPVDGESGIEDLAADGNAQELENGGTSETVVNVTAATEPARCDLESSLSQWRRDIGSEKFESPIWNSDFMSKNEEEEINCLRECWHMREYNMTLPEQIPGLEQLNGVFTDDQSEQQLQRFRAQVMPKFRSPAEEMNALDAAEENLLGVASGCKDSLSEFVLLEEMLHGNCFLQDRGAHPVQSDPPALKKFTEAHPLQDQEPTEPGIRHLQHKVSPFEGDLGAAEEGKEDIHGEDGWNVEPEEALKRGNVPLDAQPLAEKLDAEDTHREDQQNLKPQEDLNQQTVPFDAQPAGEDLGQEDIQRGDQWNFEPGEEGLKQEAGKPDSESAISEKLPSDIADVDYIDQTEAVGSAEKIPETTTLDGILETAQTSGLNQERSQPITNAEWLHSKPQCTSPAELLVEDYPSNKEIIYAAQDSERGAHPSAAADRQRELLMYSIWSELSKSLVDWPTDEEEEEETAAAAACVLGTLISEVEREIPLQGNKDPENPEASVQIQLAGTSHSEAVKSNEAFGRHGPEGRSGPNNELAISIVKHSASDCPSEENPQITAQTTANKCCSAPRHTVETNFVREEAEERRAEAIAEETQRGKDCRPKAVQSFNIQNCTNLFFPQFSANAEAVLETLRHQSPNVEDKPSLEAFEKRVRKVEERHQNFMNRFNRSAEKRERFKKKLRRQWFLALVQTAFLAAGLALALHSPDNSPPPT